MSEKRSTFEGMSFSDTELRVPNEKPPLKFALEEQNWNEVNKVQFALRDDAKASLESRRNAKKKAPSGNGLHKAKAHNFSGGTIKDLSLWTGTMMSSLAKKPREIA